MNVPGYDAKDDGIVDVPIDSPTAYKDEPDFYESQPGDAISWAPGKKRTKKTYLGFGLMVFGVLLLLVGILAVSIGRGEEAAEESLKQKQKQSGGHPNRSPISPLRPTLPPVNPTAAPVNPTIAPVNPTTAPVEPVADTPAPVEASNPVETPAPVEFPVDTPAPVQAPVATPAPVQTTPAPVVVTPAPTQQDLLSYISALVPESDLLDVGSIANEAFTWLQENSQVDTYEKFRIRQRFGLAALYRATASGDGWNHSPGWMTNDDECTWKGIRCDGSTVVALNLTANGLFGTVPDEISVLGDSLISLVLSHNSLTNANEELAWLGKLTNLKLLDVEHTTFAFDGLPTYLKQLTELRVLDVASTMFLGHLDGSIFANMQYLRYLELGDNLYESEMPIEITQLPDLEALYAYNTGLEGNLEFIVQLDKIFELWLDDNDITGTIPTGIGGLTDLASLSLTDNDLYGEIPTEIGYLTDMEQMWLFGNWLSGEIPTEIGFLSELRIFAIEDNNITDVSMPQQICDLEMDALSADCAGDYVIVQCSCCDCCDPVCPIADLAPLHDGGRRFMF